MNADRRRQTAEAGHGFAMCDVRFALHRRQAADRKKARCGAGLGALAGLEALAGLPVGEKARLKPPIQPAYSSPAGAVLWGGFVSASYTAWASVLLFMALSALLLSGCAAPVTTAALAKVETGVDAAAWAQVPAGQFVLGQHEEKGMVETPYEIMVTDVTNVQYARYLNEALATGSVKIRDDQVVGYYPGDLFHGHKHEKEIKAGDWLHVPLADPSLRLTFDGKTFGVKSGYEAHPMTLVTWFGAKAYCDFYGWRLPSELEWEKAARGTDDRPFPWGDEIKPNNANFYASRDPFERLAGKQGDTTPVGFYNGKAYDGYETTDSRSPFGLYDMAGNVWQWTADLQAGIHDRWLRGGSKDNYGYNLRIWEHNSARPDYASPSVGFRCARAGK